LRSRKYYLEKDLKDKFTALSLDEHCSSLNNHSENIAFSSDKAIIDTKSVTPSEWESFSDENILKAERERAASATLCLVIDDVLDSTRNDMKRQRQAVNTAFDKRVKEQLEAKQSLKNHLSKVVAEINEMESNIAALEEAIAAKTPPMKVAQTRLHVRGERPNVELVRDPVQYRLIEEVAEITDTLQQLQVQLAESHSSLKGLNRRQLSLEEDIQVKSNSLDIDQNKCMKLRQQLPE
jgi:tektin-1